MGPFSGPPHRGPYTRPGLRQPRGAAALLDKSFHSDPFRCCAVSGASGTHWSTGPVEAFHRRSPPFCSPVQHSLRSGSQSSFRLERPPPQGLGCPDPGSACLAPGRRESSHLRGMASRQALFPDVETDVWSPLEGPAVHHVQARNVPSA